MRAAGLVLAGGRALRFGAEKAMALLDATPLVAHAARALTPCEAVAVVAPDRSGAADWARAQGHSLLADPPDTPRGPLAGVLAGLRWAHAAGAEALVTTPCDTPFLPDDYVPWLLAGLRSAPAAVAVAGGARQPLCAAWKTDLHGALAARLAAGHPSVHRLLDEFGAAEAAFPEACAFVNLNTPDDLALHAGRHHPPGVG